MIIQAHDPDSIQVYVDDERVPRIDENIAEENQCGWDYRVAENAIAFFGEDCVPGYNSSIDIYYTPEAAGGRPLPF